MPIRHLRAPVRGTAYMVLATLVGVAVDVLIKRLTLNGVAPVTMVMVRNLVQVVTISALAPLFGTRIRLPERWDIHFYRGIRFAFVSGSLFLSLRELPMTQVFAIGFSSPLITALLGSLLLRERCNARGLLPERDA